VAFVLLMLLLSAAAARAATFTVGPAGTYATIQPAIDAAMASGEDSEVRVQSGTYFERLTIDHPPGSLSLLGGYATDFGAATRSASADTIVDAEAAGRPLTLTCDLAGVVVEGLSLVNGLVTSSTADVEGGGMAANVLGSCRLELRRLVVANNRIAATTQGLTVFGGGASLHLGENAHLLMESVRIERNEAAAHGDPPPVARLSDAHGAGLCLFVEGDAEASLRAITVADNVLAGSDTFVFGVGAAIAAGRWLSSSPRASRATLSLVDSSFVGNRVTTTGHAAGTGAGLWVFSGYCAGCVVELRRNEVRANSCAGFTSLWMPSERRYQMETRIDGSTTFDVSDTLIANGDHCGGLNATAPVGPAPDSPAGVLRLTNLTVVDHRDGIGITAFTGINRFTDRPTPLIRIANTISYANGGGNLEFGGDDPSASTVPVLVEPSNLFGIDPLFAAPALGDYRLRVASPAIDVGDDAPPGGLGPQDLNRTARVKGPHVDIGAYETMQGHCLAMRPPGVAGLFPAVFVPVCACLRDPVFLVNRCGFQLPDFFMVVEVPLAVPPFSPYEARWTIYPRNLGSAPYAMSAAMRAGSQWVPQAVSPGQGTLAGSLVRASVRGQAPGGPAVLSTQIRYWPNGAQTPRGWELEVLLPVGVPRP
jgi:hypothetical protein